ncbi:hypothetical protein AB837_00007 [bacterium AB1]|nr:hypothetical protein AB837_00007 [bacterium AB1]
MTLQTNWHLLSFFQIFEEGVMHDDQYIISQESKQCYIEELVNDQNTYTILKLSSTLKEEIEIIDLLKNTITHMANNSENYANVELILRDALLKMCDHYQNIVHWVTDSINTIILACSLYDEQKEAKDENDLLPVRFFHMLYGIIENQINVFSILSMACQSQNNHLLTRIYNHAQITRNKIQFMLVSKLVDLSVSFNFFRAAEQGILQITLLRQKN